MHVSCPSLEISSFYHNGEHGVLAVSHYGRPSRVPEGPCLGVQGTQQDLAEVTEAEGRDDTQHVVHTQKM